MKNNSAYLMRTLGLVAIATLSCLAPIRGLAQITITESDMTKINSYYITANDSTPTVAPGSSGASQTWNLGAIHNQSKDTLYCLGVSGQPDASKFPSANEVLRQYSYNAGTAYEYVDLNSSAFSLAGIANVGANSGFGVVTPATTIFSFPATYMATWNTTYREVAKFSIGGGDSAEQIIKNTYTSLVDGWGSVTTPSGTYNALRIKETTTSQYDSLFENVGSGWVFITKQREIPSETYSWVANGVGYTLASLNMDSAGGSVVSSAAYLIKSVAGIEDITSNTSADVYPNPSSSLINIVVKSSKANGYVKIVDITGREIESSLFNNGKSQLNTSAYANGMYLYLITDMNGNLLDKGKFTVSH
jgi:Secretion system C-terminal sorting domain